MKEYISTRAFVELLVGRTDVGTYAGQNTLESGYEKGWLEQQDLLEAEAKINRRSAARILHEFLRVECGEADTEQWQEATKLQDLYDCRVCVNHVAQMFAKGIMTGIVKEHKMGGADHQSYALVFGMTELVTNEEATLFVERLWNPGLRVLLSQSTTLREKSPYAIPVKQEEVAAFLEKYPQCILVDVRTKEAFEQGHRAGAIHVSMSRILTVYGEQGGSLFGEDDRLLLYCDMGYQSEIAANCLKSAGFREVFYVE